MKQMPRRLVLGGLFMATALVASAAGALYQGVVLLSLLKASERQKVE